MHHTSMPRLALLTAIPMQINRDLVDQQEALGGRLMVPAFNDTAPRVLPTRVPNQIDGIRMPSRTRDETAVPACTAQTGRGRSLNRSRSGRTYGR